jgi:hypothetical protein
MKRLDSRNSWIDAPPSTKNRLHSKQSVKVTVVGEKIVIVVADPSASLDEFGKAFTRELVDRGKCMLELCGGNEQLEHGTR